MLFRKAILLLIGGTIPPLALGQSAAGVEGEQQTKLLQDLSDKIDSLSKDLRSAQDKINSLEEEQKNRALKGKKGGSEESDSYFCSVDGIEAYFESSYDYTTDKQKSYSRWEMATVDFAEMEVDKDESLIIEMSLSKTAYLILAQVLKDDAFLKTKTYRELLVEIELCREPSSSESTEKECFLPTGHNGMTIELDSSYNKLATKQKTKKKQKNLQSIYQDEAEMVTAKFAFLDLEKGDYTLQIDFIALAGGSSDGYYAKTKHAKSGIEIDHVLVQVDRVKGDSDNVCTVIDRKVKKKKQIGPVRRLF